MKTRFLMALCACSLYLSVMTSAVYGQAWVKPLFEESTYDFGNVPRGAHVEHEFVVSNKYQEALHIAQVKSSCGCTIPRIEKQNLKTYEKGAIICEFNTRSFIGPKSAVVTVVFTAPYYGEMQLMVKGTILSDMVTDPGEIQFGELDRGTEKSTSVKVTYTGNKPWEITDVRSANQHLGVKLNRIEKKGPVEYEMLVRLKDSAPAGDFTDQIVLVTNDSEYNLITIPVRGNVLPPLVMPVSVELGTFRSGQSKTSSIVIKSNQDFEVTEVECPDQRFTFSPTRGKSAKVHLIPVEFKAGEVGAFARRSPCIPTCPKEVQPPRWSAAT
ncbi:MAG: DUF1573 domain-containing protein [Pirellulaceae bacterium]